MIGNLNNILAFAVLCVGLCSGNEAPKRGQKKACWLHEVLWVSIGHEILCERLRSLGVRESRRGRWVQIVETKEQKFCSARIGSEDMKLSATTYCISIGVR